MISLVSSTKHLEKKQHQLYIITTENRRERCTSQHIYETSINLIPRSDKKHCKKTTEQYLYKPTCKIQQNIKCPAKPDL